MINNLKFWVQPVQPLSFDDSISYLEFLGKVCVKLNEVIDSQNTVTGEFAPLKAQVEEITQNIDKYISDKVDPIAEDLQDKINAAITQINSQFDSLSQTLNAEFSKFSSDQKAAIASLTQSVNQQISTFESSTNADIAAFKSDVNSSNTTFRQGIRNDLSVMESDTNKKIDRLSMQIGSIGTSFTASNMAFGNKNRANWRGDGASFNSKMSSSDGIVEAVRGYYVSGPMSYNSSWGDIYILYSQPLMNARLALYDNGGSFLGSVIGETTSTAAIVKYSISDAYPTCCTFKVFYTSLYVNPAFSCYVDVDIPRNSDNTINLNAITEVGLNTTQDNVIYSGTTTNLEMYNRPVSYVDMMNVDYTNRNLVNPDDIVDGYYNVNGIWQPATEQYPYKTTGLLPYKRGINIISNQSSPGSPARTTLAKYVFLDVDLNVVGLLGFTSSSGQQTLNNWLTNCPDSVCYMRACFNPSNLSTLSIAYDSTTQPDTTFKLPTYNDMPYVSRSLIDPNVIITNRDMGTELTDGHITKLTSDRPQDYFGIGDYWTINGNRYVIGHFGDTTALVSSVRKTITESDIPSGNLGFPIDADVQSRVITDLNDISNRMTVTYRNRTNIITVTADYIVATPGFFNVPPREIVYTPLFKTFFINPSVMNTLGITGNIATPVFVNQAIVQGVSQNISSEGQAVNITLAAGSTVSYIIVIYV